MDQRAIDYWSMEEVSIGDYILTGGELPATALIDAVARFIPGRAWGVTSRPADESVYSGLFECDHRRQTDGTYQGMEVPEVLAERQPQTDTSVAVRKRSESHKTAPSRPMEEVP